MNLSAEFEKWGRVLVIENTDSTRTAPFKGFIQPLRYKNKMYLYGVNTEIGYNSQGYYKISDRPRGEDKARRRGALCLGCCANGR